MPDVISLKGKLDLTAVSALHSDLCARKGQDLVLDLGAASHLGALCVQLLISAARQARAGGKRFELQNADDRVLAQLALMGMTPETVAEG